jgi:flavin-binding protein dodecin
MAVAKITEISATSKKGFEDAITVGLRRAEKTLRGISGAWVKSMKVDYAKGKIVDYRVLLKVSFILKG